MGLFDGLTNGNGLFNLGGVGNNGMPAGAMGGLLDPAALQKYKLKNLMLGAGMSLLSQGPSSTPIDFGSTLGKGLAGGLTAAQAAQQDYMQNAKMAWDMKRQEAQDQMARHADQRAQAGFDQNSQLFPGQLRGQQLTNAAAQTQADNQAHFNDWVKTRPPEEQIMWQQDPKGMATAYRTEKFGSATPPNYGMTPQYGIGADGKPVLLQMGDNGTIIQPKLPDGITLVGPYDKAFQKSQGSSEGEMTGKQNISAPQAIQSAKNALQFITDVRNSPNKGWGTGMTSMLDIPGTGVRDFKNQVQGLKSGAFLAAIDSMRGLGSLSDAEGSAATAAINRMDVSTSEEAFDSALNDYEQIVKQGLARSQGYLNRQSNGTPTQTQPIPAPQGGSQNLTDEQLLKMYGG